eukprot:CAMPEP_0118875960 /NCGR_PEP_ID=MMETSP1163-20130328/16841_1 /TAXON_ID=124430 /ORGANISM="Phaeomonas parva, Strain CCMP2877" /LENGTH=151 /DNA_ID=CAMNT_0006811527 /DNA_START=137 /DNA_END=589 /DNA_ORIENTATION=-
MSLKDDLGLDVGGAEAEAGSMDRIAGVAVLSAVPMLWGTYAPAVRTIYNLPTPPPSVLLNSLSLSVSFAALSTALTLTRAANPNPNPNADPSADPNPSAASADPSLATTLRYGFELGLYLFMGSSIQLLGLEKTTATAAGFIVQLTTIIVP